jgi:hypothetical protein
MGKLLLGDAADCESNLADTAGIKTLAEMLAGKIHRRRDRIHCYHTNSD